VRGSATGTTDEVLELELIIDEIRNVHAQVKTQRLSGLQLSRDELLMLNMVAECERLSGELKSEIQKLRVRDDAFSRTLESLRVTVRALWKKEI
jgi:hypothetical protein